MAAELSIPGVFEPVAAGFGTGVMVQTVLPLKDIVESGLRILGMVQELFFDGGYLVGKLAAVDAGIQSLFAEVVFYIIKRNGIDAAVAIQIGGIELHGRAVAHLVVTIHAEVAGYQIQITILIKITCG